MWIGLIVGAVGLVMLAVAGFGYYEEEKHKPLSLGLLGLLYRYRLWLGVGGATLLAAAAGLVLWDGKAGSEAVAPLLPG